MSHEARQQGAIPLSIAFPIWIVTVVAGLTLGASILRNSDKYCAGENSGEFCGLGAVVSVIVYGIWSFVAIAFVAELAVSKAPKYSAILMGAMFLGAIAVGLIARVLPVGAVYVVLSLPVLIWAGVMVSAPVAFILALRRSGRRPALHKGGLLLTVLGCLVVSACSVAVALPQSN